MNKKMKACFTGHVMLHSLFGLGLGIILATLIPPLQMVWLGFVILVIAVVGDAMRK